MHHDVPIDDESNYMLPEKKHKIHALSKRQGTDNNILKQSISAAAFLRLSE